MKGINNFVCDKCNYDSNNINNIFNYNCQKCILDRQIYLCDVWMYGINEKIEKTFKNIVIFDI